MMMTLVEFFDPGLVILPVHRLMRGITPATLAGLGGQLENFFIVESIPLAGLDSNLSEAVLDGLKPRVNDEVVLGVLGLEPGYLIVARKRQDIFIEGIMPEGRSQAYRELDVSLLNHLILGKMLGLADGEGETVYTTDVGEALQLVKVGEYQVAFLLSPPNLEVVKTVTNARDKMPQKSTYFYPKLPTGLVINLLD